MRLCTILLFASFAFVSCGPGLHLFNAANPPCLTKRNSGAANVYIGGKQLELQGAFSPVNQLGIMGNASFGFGRSVETKLFEGSIGFYNHLSDYLHTELYLGGGYGERRYNGPSENMPFSTADFFDFSAYYSKFFVQPAIFSKKDRKEFVASVQIGGFFFRSITFKEKFAAHANNTVPDVVVMKNDAPVLVSLQPALTFKFGANKVKFVTQVSSNFFVDDGTTLPEITKYIPLSQQWLQITLGLQIRFGKID